MCSARIVEDVLSRPELIHSRGTRAFWPLRQVVNLGPTAFTVQFRDTRKVLLRRGRSAWISVPSALAAGANEPRAASVVALDDVTAQTIAAEDFLRFMERHPAVSFRLLRQLAARLREANLRHTEAAGFDALHRVARVLVDQADRQGRVVDDGLQVGVGLSQADLAGLVAASPKSVGRALAVLRTRGLITTGRRSVIIRDLVELRRFAG